ncbi:MAG TPA: response regulator transcription factor [Treponemataceae bacterium]|nr:response regulator transcription factor [Treponemataceae bacterium]HPS44650.1 response regulator transcription factor [Treponemataceae bacterium]
MKARILIIEDVKELADLVALYLAKEGMETFWAETAEIALERIESWTPDLVILDINLPGMDGFQFLDRFRKAHATPVLIVSARTADEDIIAGLGYGADEFVSKPFSPRVLVARVRALIRRAEGSQGQAESEECVCFGPYALLTNSCILKKGSERIPLSAREYEVLSFLAANPGRPLSPETIYNAVWKNAYGDMTAVAVYIQRLRKKLEDDPASPRYIETVFGMGYRFCLDASGAAESPSDAMPPPKEE